MVSNVIRTIKLKSIYHRPLSIPIINIILILIILYVEIKTINEFSSITNGKTINIDNKSIHYLNIRNNNNNDKPDHLTSLSLYHGFGSNSLSFKPIIDSLMSRSTNTNYYITAHDIPGFGFGERDGSKKLQPMFYRPLWNALVGDTIMNSNKVSSSKIIFGHSMGCIPALISGIIAKNNNNNVTVVLECPALKYSNIMGCSNESNIMKFITNKLNNLKPIHTKKSITDRIIGLVMKTILFPIRLALKIMLRSRYFWKRGLSVAYTAKVSEIKNEIFDGYRLAAYANEFDVDLLNFVNSQKQGIDDSVIGSPFPSSMILPGISHMDLLLTLCKLKTKVIIVHGIDDKIVPLQNSIDIVNSIKKNLNDDDKQYIELRTINLNGHVPHEEDANQLLEILNDII